MVLLMNGRMCCMRNELHSSDQYANEKHKHSCMLWMGMSARVTMHNNCVTQLQNNFIFFICRNMSKRGLVFYFVFSYGIISSCILGSSLPSFNFPSTLCTLSHSSEEGVHTGFQKSSQRIQGYFSFF